MRIGAIEAGGTKFVCGIGNELGTIEDRVSFPTEHPERTLSSIIAYFEDKQVEAIGIGTFGPIDINPASSTYGFVTTTPKPGWSGFDFLGTMKQAFDLPFGWDTDVNAAAYGEAAWGAAKGLDSCVYYTVGTGIGVGVYAEGKLVHGLVHPEGGHILVRRHKDDTFLGNCPYHGDCLEGMASGPAIEQRWKVKGNELSTAHSAWEMEAYYIAQAITSTILLLSPKKVILGGGVMQQKQLFPLIRAEVQRHLNGYVSSCMIMGAIETYIVPPGLGDNAGLCGALALGLAAVNQAKG
ncbi:putative fructokinase [Paenibacillus baekrokdamisoli]|uniref:fructokinase n=1 Tax=Paenibacillus baekrokdamisoli TaxID=1712516 RepID=A0A3G9JMV5_9BACL|nr:ROK family protein [Paenibacillus baekrokdamisoli]MBB3071824.1 fructokinase [Paenibacillus baekrokdamisoli]BBH24194.1 putative fructokinase [Paenibacillus baekrokdamisoli]